MTMLIFLPSAQRGYRWIDLTEGAMPREGDGIPTSGAPFVAVAPAEAVTLHWATLPDRSIAQATAAARIVVAEASAAPLGELHVAVGDEGTGERPIGVVAAAQMQEWLAALAAVGIDPVAIIPAPMLLPRPDEGYVRAQLAGEGVVRGTAAGFADEARLTELVTGGTAPTTLDRASLTTALADAVAAPALDLRQGAFARRTRRAIDWPLIRRLAMLGAGILLLTLAIDVVRIIRYSTGADALEARADALGRTGLPRGETVTDVDRQLDERLSAVRGPGAGFTATTAAVYSVVRTLPGVEITGLDFQPNGELRLSIAVAREALATDLRSALQAAGFEVRAGVFQSGSGRVTGEMTVSRP
ncbi:type II secretion system protein GspL [uncultured Sphingomonas sp.]|uniref:type II secretion system protein GspL n=1 Tax=uncultured Sphingomonas sp. TaxID=158754 RepID=UPI0035CBD4C6